MERLSKVIITLKPNGRKASDIEAAMDHWFQAIPRNLLRSITFDCGKEFSNHNDIAIYFADPGTPLQRALTEKATVRHCCFKFTQLKCFVTGNCEPI